MKESDLVEIEELYSRRYSSQEQGWILRLITEVRELQHQLTNPNYLYAGGRIHRQAILWRDNEIESLQKELAEKSSAKS